MGELWELGDGSAGSPRVRRRTLRRWALPLVGGALLVASLVSAVRRSEEGRMLSRELDRLEGAELILRDEVAEQVARTDSLSGLPRMEEAAAAIGLRRAGDGELFHLSDGVGEGR